jgi:hypothetical protein
LLGWSTRLGELLRSVALGVSSSSSKIAMGFSPTSVLSRERAPGNISSTGFLGVLARLGEPAGLEGRCGEVVVKNPVPYTPGIDFARDMTGA